MQNLFSAFRSCSQEFCPRDQHLFVPVGFIVVLASLLVLPLDVSQLSAAVAGAAVYTVLQYISIRSGGNHLSRKISKVHDQPSCTDLVAQVYSLRRQGKPNQKKSKSGHSTRSSFEADVEVLLEQILPTAASDKTASRLADAVKGTASKIFPEVDVTAFAVSNIAQGAHAFCVAVPDVEVVISISASTLANRLQRVDDSSRRRQRVAKPMDARQLEKAAIRLIVDALVSERGFKFRRSAFKVEEPKLTLLAPSFFIESGLPVPLDICVNALTPLYHASVLSECSQIDEGIKELILFTRRWAKDRGICHASKGHLSPYYWMLLVIYYLQVRPEQSNASLPPLADFRSSIDLLGMPAAGNERLHSQGFCGRAFQGICAFLRHFRLEPRSCGPIDRS
eukprot:TRINITY_DN13663_c0_g1_i2.p1 TRINITY_DN13663_c0_g1~~TRINITY_DN13663_c0_g1_i2.p1  ORF type:complete len:394 (+),score=58.83 TRINITY_DN13663_c0_g1_i2:107-1288(+)